MLGATEISITLIFHLSSDPRLRLALLPLVPTQLSMNCWTSGSFKLKGADAPPRSPSIR
jgi:hypothetical protein